MARDDRDNRTPVATYPSVAADMFVGPTAVAFIGGEPVDAAKALRDFVGIDLSRESVPDATTLLKFRRLLLANDLTKTLFDEINEHLAEKGLLMIKGAVPGAKGSYVRVRDAIKQARPAEAPYPAALAG